MLINMSAATSNATCMTAGTLLHKGVDLHGSTAPPSPIGFEATLSVAMELETSLKAESSDQYSPQPSPDHVETSGDSRQGYPEDRCSTEPSDSKDRATTNIRHVGNGHLSLKSLNENGPQMPSNGNGHHREDTLPRIQDKQLEMLNDSTDVMMDGDLIDDDDDDSNGHSSGSEGHCSYGDISVDTSKEDDMDEDLDPLHKLPSPLERNALHPGVGNGPHGRPDSGEGDYYEGGCNDSSQLTSLCYQQHGQLYQCHLCSFSSPSKFHFNSHLNTHYDHKCGLCDYRSRTEGRLKRHMKDFHSDLAPEIVSEKGGKIKGDGSNGQSKSKTYRCKQCSYVATVKAEFWAHSKSHIKAEKLLTCPRCPFVTEYKHHLEYHLRNHFGSKPFRCPKCSYSCVNKSMLNSHMKSHSNVYQYRCADCTYATKYCHSLKLHLRKYTHTPATVLNLDGTPNPMPIIDVYGTRRGPRVKKNQIDLYNNDSNPGSNGNGSGPMPFSPIQVPVNGSGLSSAVIPFFYAGDGSAPLSNGFHTSNDGLMQHSGNISKPTPHVNNHVKEEPTENGRQMNNGGGGGGGVASLKCNLCDFSTDHNEMFSKHMLLHAAAENQDLCNLYGINSESLLQDPNQQQQQHSQMNVATMAAVAAALGFGGHHPLQLTYHNHRGGGNNGLHRQVPSAQQSPHQQGTSPSSQGSQESGPNTDLHTSPEAGQRGNKPTLKPHNDDGGSSGRETGPTNKDGSPHPLEHLKAFSEHVNIQPFTMRDFSSQLFPSDAHLNVQTSGAVHTEDGHRIGNLENISTEKFAHSPNGLYAKYSPPSQQPNAKKAKTGTAKLPKREVVGGFGPLDLSSAKPLSRHSQYLNVHQLHHYQSPFQHFSMQQLQRSQQLSMAALQQHRFAQQVSATSLELSEGASFEEPGCQLSPPTQGQTLPEGSQQQKHRRKGKAFKLDRICMKLQKEKGPTSPNGHQTGFNVDDAEESGDEMTKEDCNKSTDEEFVQEQQQDIGTPKLSPPVVPIPYPTSPKPSPGASSLSSAQNKVSKAKEGAEDKNGTKEEEEPDGGGANWKEAYQCQYCDMAFKDCIMYTVHMGYHGFKDPFKCNMCGQQTNDKVAFFLHIARTAHL